MFRMTLLCVLLNTLIPAFLIGQVLPGDHEWEHDHFAMEKERFLAKMNFVPNSFTSDYDVKYHRMEWKVDPAIQYINGEVTTYFIPKSDNFNSIHFDFSDTLQCTRAIYRGQDVPFESIGNHTLAIDFPSILTEGVLDSITVVYEGAPASSGFSSFNADTHNDTPVLWTLSQPYGARDWWPCKQNLTDKIDSIDVWVTCPNMYKVASNGLLQEIKDEGNDLHTYRWAHRYPIPAYLIAIGVTNYEVFSQFVDLPGGDSLEVLNYVYPESRDRAEADLVWTIPMMELFNDLFGLYPFAEEKYGHAQFGFGGGMEHQTMSFMGGYSFELQAHELAHQWFGNKVTCGSWQDIWLNEGFATYLTGVSIEHLSPRFWFGWKRGNRDRIVREPGGSLYVRDTSGIATIFSPRLSYSKGAFVLHQLRWLLGDDQFYQGCRDFLEDPELSFDYATTEDFCRVMEAAGDTVLGEYFDDYVYQAGQPTFELYWYQAMDTLYMSMEQTTSDPSVDFFEMTVPIRVYGQQDSLDINLHHFNQKQRWSVYAPAKIDSIVIDPDIWLISKDNKVVQDPNLFTVQPLDDIATVYPNPFNEYLEINFLEEKNVRVELYDISGNRMINDRSTTNSWNVSTKEWPSGTYFMYVHIGNEKYGKTVVKSH